MITTFVKFSIIFFIWIIEDSTEIQNVKLILPTTVQAGTSATLLCLFDLEGATLYSVQWYRGQFEFFRFVPKENPPTKVFQIPGLYVDTFASSEHQVTLKNIPLQISGEFSCEITTDAPRFSTSCVSENLTVIDVSLSLEIPKKVYNFGDMIDASCSLSPKNPSTKLIFHWNSKPISDVYITGQFDGKAHLHLNTSVFDTGLKVQVPVQLRCSAISEEIYYVESKSVLLKFEPSDSASESKATESGIYLHFVFLIILQKILIQIS